jgi:hypothetical protein
LKPVVPSQDAARFDGAGGVSTPAVKPIAGNILAPKGGLKQPQANFDPASPNIAITLESKKEEIKQIAKEDLVVIPPLSGPPSSTTPIAGNVNVPKGGLRQPQGNIDTANPKVSEAITGKLGRSGGFGQITPVATPPVTAPVVPLSKPASPTTLEPLKLAASKIVSSEINIFGVESLLKLPVNPEAAEYSSGISLEKWEKPRVLAVIAQQVNDGYQQKNTLICKKLISNRTKVESYKILKKNIFKEKSEFKIAAHVNSLYMNIDAISQDHIDYIKQLGYNPKECFIYEDPWISPNSAYAYKIEIEWVSNGELAKQPQIPDAAFTSIVSSLADFSKLFFGA